MKGEFSMAGNDTLVDNYNYPGTENTVGSRDQSSGGK